MAKERLKSPRARLFVALDLPGACVAGIEAWGREALADPALRPLPAASLHITLAFLGYRPEKEIGRIGEIVEALAGRRRGSSCATRCQRRRGAGRGSSRCRSSPPETVALQAGAGGEAGRRAASTSPRSGRSGPT